MGFPYMNAITVNGSFQAANAPTTTGFLINLATGPHVFVNVPGVVDVSGMEYSIYVRADNSSGKAGIGAGTASAASLALVDGGPTGDATTTALLAAVLTSTVEWEDTVPRDVTGTSATDLDADDWVNFQVSAQPTTTPGVSQADVSLTYIYGKPGAIN
jgi:hypothetical protein